MMDLSKGGDSHQPQYSRGGRGRGRGRMQHNHDDNIGSHNQGPPNRGSYNQGPPNWGSHNQGPPNRGSYNQGPPNWGSYNQGPPNRGSYNQGPPNRGSHNQGPPNRGSYNQGPPNRGSYNQGPPNRGSYNQGPPNRGSYNQGPPNRGSYNQGPPNRGSYNQGPPNRGSYNQGPHNQGPHNHRYFNQDHRSHPPSYDETMGYPSAPPLMPEPRNRGSYNQGPHTHRHINQDHRSHPPSYDETMGYPSAPPLMPEPLFSKFPPKHSSPRRNPQHHNVQELVKALALFNGQWATAETLSKHVQWSEEEVIGMVQSCKDLFSFMNNGKSVMVELVPNISLCSEYLSQGGCMAKRSCKSLHICKTFIMGYCDSRPCQYGHKFDTNQNSTVLSKLYLDLIEYRVLHSIIKKVCKGNASPRLCGFYNTKEGCRKNDRCDYFHICKDYMLNSGKCPNNNCQYNHRLDTKQCQGLLIHYGISINESPRDIILNLRSSLQNLENFLPGAEVARDGKAKTGDYGRDSVEASSKGKETGAKQKPLRSPTVRSTDLCGNVAIPEICIYNINNKCTNENKGCKYLHAKSLFHWQVEKDNKWYNLRIFQSKCLETAYRDVSKEGVKLPPLDPNKIESQNNKMLDIIGSVSWTADFQSMQIRNSSGSRLKIRRVSTASSAVSNLPQATVFEWFFNDENDKWILYGHVDSLGKQQLVCNINSADIEKQYMLDSSQPMVISSAQYKYQLDFDHMIQTNLNTGKVRRIRRRPSRLSYQKSSTSESEDNSLPKHWRPMNADQTHVLMTLDRGSQEFEDVVSRVRLTLPTVTIHTVQRLQNQYLWRLMQYKKADLSHRYDNYQLNMQKLFHGTSSDLIDGICKENIDWRVSHNKKQDFGKGTYFSNSCATARNYCSPDVRGRFFMVLTEVIIGEVTQGSNTLSRPPVNPVTAAMFDTTVDNLQAPTIFVKYDKEEYYPEYMVELH